jgi:hypothetical protein
MDVISINKFIDSRGLIIKPEDINDFINSNVRITIEKVRGFDNHNKVLDFAGSLNNEEAELIEKSIDECRKIDLDTWK